jgi:PAS domain S-box-containing protein
MVVTVDINEEKSIQQKAEEITKRFRFLADSMPQQIWTADAKGNLNYFSRAFYEYTGIRNQDIRSSNWTKLVFSKDRKETYKLWKHSLETGEEFVAEHRLKRRDGQFIWQLSRAIAQRDQQGKIIMWVGTTSNIHRQKTVSDELEKQVAERTHDLEQANFNLKHSNHDLEQFAYIATHDLQEPLRKIRTYASWINKRHLQQLPEEAQDYLIKIENASERMSILIDDLLNYSLLLRPQEAYEITDLNYILDQVLRDFDAIIRERNATIQREELPPLKAVPLQIYQLFYNILSNSFKFAKEGQPPVISIKSRILTEAEIIALKLDIDLSYTEIIFQDNGIGFMQEYAEKIFSIFQRLHSRQKYPGTGIGLALCQKIVTYHHGRIYASSNENEGASMYIALPL